MWTFRSLLLFQTLNVIYLRILSWLHALAEGKIVLLIRAWSLYKTMGVFKNIPTFS